MAAANNRGFTPATTNIDVSAKDIGGIIKSVTATGSANVRANATMDMDENWMPKASVNADYSWNDKIGVDILGQKVTFSSKVDPKIKDAIAKLETNLSRQISKLDVNKKLSDAWMKGFTTIQISKNPPTWLRFTPQKVGYSGYDINDGAIKLTLMAKGITETFVGPRASDPEPTELPKLTKDPLAGGFDFYLPVVADYGVMEDAAKNALEIGEAQMLDIPNVGAVKVIFKDVSIYQTTGNAVALGVTLTVDPPGQIFDTSGTVWLSTKLRVDNDTKTTGVESLDVYGQTDNPAFSLLLSVLQIPTINDRLKSGLTYDFKANYADVLAKASEAMNRPISRDLYLEGQVTDATIDQVKATPQGLFLGVEVRGTAALRYAAVNYP